MTGTKTGNGGFEIDGKVHEFDVGDPSAAGLDPVNPDHGDISVDNSKKDISKKTKVTLGKYLSNLTLGKEGSAKGNPNAFPVDPPGSELEPTEISLSDTKGLPSHIAATTNSARFSSDGDPANPQGSNGTVFDSPDLRDWSSTQPDGSTKLGDLGKGKEGKKNNGNNLLKGVGKNKTPEPIETYRATVLTTNRFTANAQTYDPNASSQPPAGPEKYRINGKDYSANQLKQVGVMLSLRGSQEFPAAFSDNVNPVNAGSVAGALLPSPNQLGILKVPGKLLEALDALQTLSDQDDSPAELDIAPIGHQSWGALNNVEEPWSGTLNLGMIAMALALQAAVLLAFEGLSSLIGLAGGQPNTTAINPSGARVKGKSTSTSKASSNPFGVGSSPDIMSTLGIHGTTFPFGDALRVGTAAFFVGGEHAKANTGGLLSIALSSVTSQLADNASAGYLIIVSRLIIRTGQSVAAQVQKISAAFSSNPISGIKAIAGLLDIIKQSKLISAMNIFSQLGDAILTEDTYSKDVSGPSEIGIVSSIDAISQNSPGASVKKNRIKKPGDATGNPLKLAWASNRAPASYLIPESIATMGIADVKLGAFRGPIGVTDPDSRGYLVVQSDNDRKANGARIPQSSPDPKGVDVEKMEALLESEYMPFYFHDVRTNEIISFHAFLASLSDDYTANWETVDGFGRVDPVKIYKSTGRRIGLSFYIIATDAKDFDEMWMKINKLVTLVYPQYTKGRTLKDEGTSFVQPFSQLISASPLVRIRLGDLIRSNYSRFALARLFGAGDGDMMLDGKQIKFEGAQKIISDGTHAKQAIDVITKAQNDPSSTYTLTSAGWASASPGAGGFGISLSLPGASTPDQAPTMKIDEGDLAYFEFKIKRKLDDSTVAVEPSIIEATSLVQRNGYDIDSAKALVDSLKSKYDNADQKIMSKVVGGTLGYAVPMHVLRLTSESINKAFSQSPGVSEAITNIEQLSAFLDVEKNALVKSFDIIKGKGLGGVIETMSFDWYDKVTWDIEPGRKAPKMCKVTIAFAPIHDISPGIDHMGYNRAPVYPVGGLMGGSFETDKSR